MRWLTCNRRYRHQLNHTPKQIYRCDFPDCDRTFVRQDLCNRHRDRHTAKGSQLHRKDSMLGHGSPGADAAKPASMHGPPSPESTRASFSGISSRTGQTQQYQSPQEMHSNPFSPVANTPASVYSGVGSSSNATDHYSQNAYKRSNSDGLPRGPDSASATPNSRPQRHSSFGVLDAKPVDFTRPPLQTAMGPYGMQNYQSSQANPQAYVSPQNFTPFTLPPPTFPAAATSSAAGREVEPYPSSMATDYPGENIQHQQSGPDMMLLDQISAPNTMPVFGGEGYNRSPFAIPEDFVAFLFSGQQVDGSSPISQMGQPGYTKSVINFLALDGTLTSNAATRIPQTSIIPHILPMT